MGDIYVGVGEYTKDLACTGAARSYSELLGAARGCLVWL